MKSLMRLIAVILFLMGTMLLPLSASAASLADIESAVHAYYTSGDIMDVDVYNTLLALLADANMAPDADAEAALRTSIVDVCSAFKGFGLSTAASNAIGDMAATP